MESTKSNAIVAFLWDITTNIFVAKNIAVSRTDSILTEDISASKIKYANVSPIYHFTQFVDGILPKGPYPLCLRMADRTLLVSCQKGPTRYAYAWQIGPFWQDTLVVCIVKSHLLHCDVIELCAGLTMKPRMIFTRTFYIQRCMWHVSEAFSYPLLCLGMKARLL